MHIFVISLHQIGGNKNSGTEKCIRKITVSWIPVEDEMRRKKKKEEGMRMEKEDEKKRKKKMGGNEDQMKHLCFGQDCMLLRFAWQLALLLQAFMRSPLLAISESYHCGDW